MNNESPYILACKKKLLELMPIDISDEDSIEPDHSFNKVNQLIEEIKHEVKKGNRVSFKFLQELQSMIEKFSPKVSENENSLKGKERHEESLDVFINLAIQAVDSMDLIYQTAIKSNHSEWGDQINSITEGFIQTLDSRGIEEVKALGEYIDGNTMKSIGNVPKEMNPNLERYQVYSVLERGFRNKESGKLIREAKVISIY